MTEREVQDMTDLRNMGKSYGDIAFIYSISERVASKWIRNYRTYGSSLFTDYPTPVIRIDHAEETAQ